MKQIKLILDLTKKYVVACSFGPDSMALLDSAIKNNLNVVVAHVNYRKREESVHEQQSLENYCKEKNIKIYVLDLIDQKHIGNFQEWAREKRYKFFADVVLKEKASGVLVAHQEDDLIETYLMQKKRKNLVKTPGISEKNELFGVTIIRPLLGYSKRDLLEYDKENGVPFSIDKTNLEDVYTRNKIRHSVVEKLTASERKTLINEIRSARTEEQQFQTRFTKSEFLALTYESIIRNLDCAMQKVHEHRDISQKFVGEIKKAFKTKINSSVQITPSVLLELDYGEVYLINSAKLKDYTESFDKKFHNKFLDIDFSTGAEDRGISNLQKNYLIKNVYKNEKLIIKNYSSTIQRLFIDWKMPHYLRRIWPGIYDGNGSLLYVPRYRKKFKDEHKSKFKINTEYFREF